MSTLEAIFKWTQEDLKPWQSDAVRRLLTQYELANTDKAEILAMLKESHGLGDVTKPAIKPQPLTRSHLPSLSSSTKVITLKAIEDLVNVNAIPNGSHIYFGHQGLTVIYGENGSGKSAFARVLKKACNARDTNEVILPNAFNKGSSEPASATIKFSVNNGKDDYFPWQDGTKTSEILSSICVFDSRCERIIVDENNEPTYLPYGAFVFSSLVKLLQEFKEQLTIEKSNPAKLAYPDISPDSKAGQFLIKLNHDTPSTLIEEKTTWTNDNESKLSNLRKDIAAAESTDTKNQVKRILNLKNSLDMIINHIVGIEWVLSESNAKSLEEAISRFNKLEKAADIVSKDSFLSEPLSGVGSSPWQFLYNAAREYSTQIAYPNRDFPVVDDKSLCVLCMQPLQDDGKSRMLKFKSFMEGTTKKELDNVRNLVEEMRTSIEKYTFPAKELVRSVLDELLIRNKSLANQMEEYLINMQLRQKQMVQSISDKRFNPLTPPKPISIECLVKVSFQIEEEARNLEKAAKPEELASKKVERDELQAWQLLCQRKKDILNYVSKLQIDLKFNNCIAETSTTSITKKGKDIVSAALSVDLYNSLKSELDNLDATRLPLNLKTTGVEGETRYRLELIGSFLPKATLTEILSEGERRVVALAGFLAELSLQDHKYPIIFDDPVCSLDHIYRDKIAERLVKESIKRQVIIFTHDISFLCELENNAKNISAYLTEQSIKRHQNTPGYCVDGLPWHAMAVGDRLKYLNDLLSELKDLHNVNIKEYNDKASFFYDLLRQTWETTVEEDLFNGAVRRYNYAVQTNNLISVMVETPDYVDIEHGMKKCSKECAAHSKAKSLDANLPSPKDIRSDLDSLISFRSRIRDRRKELIEVRKLALSEKQTEVG